MPFRISGRFRKRQNTMGDVGKSIQDTTVFYLFSWSYVMRFRLIFSVLYIQRNRHVKKTHSRTDTARAHKR